MSLTVRTNIAALSAATNVGRTQRRLESSFQKISSGLRISRAADDAAGLAIAEGLDARARSAGQAKRNANDAISAIQIAEGGSNEIANQLKRLRELAVQAGNGLLSTTERGYIENEYKEINLEIQRIADSTEFSGTKLLDNTTSITVQVGVGSSSADQIGFTGAKLTSATLGISSLAGLKSSGTPTSAKTAITAIDAALTKVNSARSTFGAVQNRLESVMRNLETYHTNARASESRIRDVDFAAETANMTRLNIMQQAGVAVLGQANQLPSAVFQLL